MNSKRCQVAFAFGILFGFLSCKLFKIITFQSAELVLLDSSVETSKSSSFELYENVLAEKLYDEVRIVCWINMSPKFHKTKAVHIKNTWGRRCNKLLFMSTEDDPDLPAIKLPVEDGLDHFWMKFKLAFAYVHEHHFNDGDWFMKADDDSYVVMENLRAMLYQYQPQTALMFGDRLTPYVSTGYMQGGCYIMSKKLLTKFVTKLTPNLTACGPVDGYQEDVFMGMTYERN